MIQRLSRHGRLRSQCLPKRFPSRFRRSAPSLGALRPVPKMIGHHEAVDARMNPPNADLPLPQHHFGMHLCNQVAAVLKGAGVENILWGSHLMATYTVPAVLQDLAFAVPNDMLRRAVASLTAQGFSLCRDVGCPLTLLRKTKWHMTFRNPSAHFHMDWAKPPWQEQWEWKRDNTLQLFAMEDVLWELPAGRGLGFTNGPCDDIILACDPSLRRGSELEGWGRFSVSGPQTDIRIPTWQRYIEALILNAMSCQRQLGWHGGWGSELALVKGLKGPHHLCRPEFLMFFPDKLRKPRPYKEVLAEAFENLGPRLHDARPRPPTPPLFEDR